MNSYAHEGKPLVYIAGPYTNPDPVENTHRTIQAANYLLDSGRVVPVVPHLTLVWHLVTPRPVEDWYALDLALLRKCDALLRLPGASTGADEEVLFARDNFIPVFHDYTALFDWVSYRAIFPERSTEVDL